MKTIIDYLNTPFAIHTRWRFPEEHREISLASLSEKSRTFASVLIEKGVSKGDRVAMILENSSDYVIALLATWRLNAVAVPIRPKAGHCFDYDQFINYTDKVCDFKLILKHSSISLPLEKTVLDVEKLHEMNGTASGYQSNAIQPNDIAVLQFSSGSTGDPKGIIVTHSMMMAQLAFLESKHVRLRRGANLESTASWLPIHHDLGLFIGVLMPVYKCAHNVLASPTHYMDNPVRWFHYLSTYKVDCSFSTNSVMASSLKVLGRLSELPCIDLSRLQFYLAAEKVSACVIEKTKAVLEPFGLNPDNVHVGYGMAENTLSATCSPPGSVRIVNVSIDEKGNVRPGHESTDVAVQIVSIGTTEPGHSVTIRDEQGAHLPDLSLGEINIQGPCVTPGYFRDKGLSRKACPYERLKTGDLGFSCDGEIYFFARKDDLIIVGGRNVVPDDVELAAESLPYIRPACSSLIGVENSETGTQELNLLVELDLRNCDKSLDEIKKEVQVMVFKSNHVVLHKILFVAMGTIEKTSSGKKRRKVIKSRLLANNVVMMEEEHGCVSGLL